MDIAEFLLARIAEDEYAAQGQAELIADRYGDVNSEPGYEVDRGWWLQVSPTRVLAECDAKRRIVADCTDDENVTFSARISESVLELLALPYADHPDYRPEWAPLVT